MKFFQVLIVILISSFAFAGDESDTIDAITPVPYARKPGTAQDFKSSTTVWFGDLVGKADISKTINDSVAPFKADLTKYYSKPGEFDALVTSLVADANKSIIGFHTDMFGHSKLNDITDAKVIQVNKFFGDKLVAQIMDRILEKEGVEDSDRRDIWIKKMLVPFDACIAKSTNAMYAASHCMESLTKSLVPSTGEALVFEISKSKLSGQLPTSEQPKFNLQQVQLYKDCLKKVAPTTTNVLNCVLAAMKDGVTKVTDISLTKTINKTASTPAKANEIKQAVWKDFKNCVGSVTTAGNINEEFNKCIDILVISTGMKLVDDKLINTKSISSQFTKAELKKLADEKVLEFKSCAEEMVKKNIRKDGMIDVDSCQNKITNEVTYKVILSTFTGTAKEMLKGNPERVDASMSVAKKSLDECWNNNQNPKTREDCIKSSVISLTKQIAEYKLEDSIPDSIANKKFVISNSIKDLISCMKENLPANISDAPNINDNISICTDKLTTGTAQLVAESEVRDSLKGKMSASEIELVVDQKVKKEFMNCLGKKQSDEKLDLCSNNLKISVSDKILDISLNQYLANRPGLDLSAKRELLKSELIASLKKCLSSHKENCTDELSKNADREIVLAYGKTETSIQLNTDQVPAKIAEVENNFKKCTDNNLLGDELSKKLDECNKNYAIEFARELGRIKLKFLLESALGSKTIADQSNVLGKISKDYDECLNDLYKFNMGDGLTDKIGMCTTDLTNKAIGMVRSNLADWMSSEQKDAATIAIKNEFASILPCLSGLLPSSPYTAQLQGNIDSSLKPVAILIAQYIEYSPEDARSNLREILKKLSEDIKSTGGNEKAKSDLIDLLYQNGALDQFIKAMVRGKVKDAFSGLSEDDLPKSIRDQLITKKNFDTIFSSADGREVKDIVLNSILKPILINGADFKSPLVNDSFSQINNKVVKMLINSPHFGDVIVKSGIQNQIEKMSGFTKFFAKVLYGSDSLNWDKVRLSEKGKEAEEYIRQNVLIPKFNGTVLTAEQEKKINLEAERIVKEAVKKYKAPKE